MLANSSRCWMTPAIISGNLADGPARTAGSVGPCAASRRPCRGSSWSSPPCTATRAASSRETFRADACRAARHPRAAGCRTTTRARRGGSCAACTSRSATARPSWCAAPAGPILDVVVDIRRGSPTFGRWEAVGLDDETLRQVYVPVGFAHGFVVLSEVADVVYRCSSYYDPAARARLRLGRPRRRASTGRPTSTPTCLGARRATPPGCAEIADDAALRLRGLRPRRRRPMAAAEPQVGARRRRPRSSARPPARPRARPSSARRPGSSASAVEHRRQRRPRPPASGKRAAASPTTSRLGAWSLTTSAAPAAIPSTITGCVPPTSVGTHMIPQRCTSSR